MGLTRKVRDPLLWILVIGSFCCLRGIRPAGADERLPVPDQVALAIQGRDLLLARDYDEAQKFLSSLVARWPRELLGFFGFMAFYQIRNFENLDFRFDVPYLLWEAKGKAMAQQILKDENATPWDLFIAGETLGIAGFHRGHHSRWFPALRDGYNGYAAMKRSYQGNGAPVDSLLGIGLYDYWRSHFTRRLRFLPFFPDRRREGRDKMMRVVLSGGFAAPLAEIAIAFSDWEEGNYPAVLETTERLLKRFPRNTILRTLQGRAFLATKKYPEAAQEFEKILLIDPTLTKSYLFLGLIDADQGSDPARARSYLEKFLEAEPQATPFWRRRALEGLKRLR